MDIWRNTERHDGIVRRFWRDSPEQFRHKSATIPPNTQKTEFMAELWWNRRRFWENSVTPWRISAE